jgi:hypothetical protein
MAIMPATQQPSPQRPRSGNRALAVLLLGILALAGLRGLLSLANREFWWAYPIEHAWFLLSLYWSALAAALVAGVAGAVLTIAPSSRWRLAGLVGAVGAGWVLLALMGGDVGLIVDDQAKIAAGGLRPAEVRYDRDARKLHVSGPITRGSAARFKDVLATAPDAQIVDVSGPGGLIFEARHISLQIEQRGLDTLISTQCASACVDIFAAGRHRLMHAKALVGLHSARSVAGDEAGVAEENRAFTERLYKIGVEPRFLMLGTETPADGIWINTARQAYLAGLATQVID